MAYMALQAETTYNIYLFKWLHRQTKENGTQTRKTPSWCLRPNLAGTVADDEAAGGACQGGDCGGGGVGGRGGGGGHPVQEELALTVPGLVILFLGALQVQVTGTGEGAFVAIL